MKQTIAILGGTGKQGRGLARRFAVAGHDVRIGSREAARARDAAASLEPTDPQPDHGAITGASNAEVVPGADLVVLATPFAAQVATLEDLRDALGGAILVTCVNPLTFDDAGPVALQVPEGSAAQQAAAALPETRVVAAFHHLAAPTLLGDGDLGDETVLVCGDDDDAKAAVLALCPAVAGRGGVDAGPLRNAGHLEDLTVVLLDVNRRNRAHAGVAITGLPS